jgi:hypothetical protein
MPSPVGEVSLQILLAAMRPQLHPAVFVFCTVPPNQAVPSTIAPIGQFHESEGLTLIVEQTMAEEVNLDCIYPCRLITLTVHSSLAAIGLLATITQALAERGISANVVSAYFHDHIFVPCDRADNAMQCLQALAQSKT